MDNTIDALKNLYVALGGEAADVADISIIPEMINAIAALVTSGTTKELPTVTSTDNGKILTVVEGAWAKADKQTELPSVTAEDNGDVLTVVEGSWAKAALPD